MKSISIKTDDTTFEKLQMITFKSSTEQKQKVYMKDVLIEAIENYTFKKYSNFLSEENEIKQIVKTPKKKKTV